jgi:hypothetical protein
MCRRPGVLRFDRSMHAYLYENESAVRTYTSAASPPPVYVTSGIRWVTDAKCS